MTGVYIDLVFGLD